MCGGVVGGSVPVLQRRSPEQFKFTSNAGKREMMKFRLLLWTAAAKEGRETLIRMDTPDRLPDPSIVWSTTRNKTGWAAAPW